MPITEFASLAFKAGHGRTDPDVSALFRKVASWQSGCSGFPPLYYTNPAVPSEMHLVGGWDSVAAHEAWIAGERNQQLLREAAPFIDIRGMVHLNVDFDRFPRDAPSITCVEYGEQHEARVEDRAGYLIGQNMQEGRREVYVFSTGEVATEGVCRRTLEKVHFE